ncbi:GNAT family N-acetyltransferase [Patescibacteria group bacterium]|nr:GNAT family N-acetyltransferase [Patescibacteria group bacterium]
MILIKRAEQNQVKGIAEITSQCFSGLKDLSMARQWTNCNFQAYPRMQYFVAQEGDKILGYILWKEKGGFRKQAVIELEQIAVDLKYRGQGIGTKIITESLIKIKDYLKMRGSSLKLIEVTTGTTNQAQKLYQKTLGAKVEIVIKDLFNGDEVIMIARFKK